MATTKPQRVFSAFRLLPTTKETIKRHAKGRGCSEAKVIDAWAEKADARVFVVDPAKVAPGVREGLRDLSRNAHILTEGRTISGGVGRLPTTPKPKIKMVAQQPARAPILKPGAKHL